MAESSEWSTDVSNDSTDDVAMGSRSRQESETDTSSVEVADDIPTEEVKKLALGQLVTPPGPFAPPPGLDLPAAPQFPCTVPHTGLSMHAKPFVPSSENQAQLSPPPAADGLLPWPHLSAQGEYPGEAPASNLQDVISKLSPQDAATVMASLTDAAMGRNYAGSAPAVPATTAVPMVFYPRSLAREPAAKASQYGEQLGDHRRTTTLAGRSQNVRSPVKTAPVARKDLTLKLQQPPEISTLKDNLRQLSCLDPKSVILVRKISKLGLNSAQLLEIHFSRFGPVHGIFVSHSIEKPSGRRVNPRWRPASLGFVAMASAEDAAMAMRHGSEQIVLGVSILLGSYEDHFAAKLEIEDQEDKESQ